MTICGWDKAVSKMYGVFPQVFEGERRYSFVWADRDGEKEIMKKAEWSETVRNAY
jgi:hypothetical protein